MNLWRTAGAALGIGLILLYAGGSNYWNRQDGWYQSLTQPSWQPPGFVFGLIWPYNFIVIGIALYTIATRSHPMLVAASLAIFAISVFFALRWSYLFYSQHDLHGAALSLAITAFLTLPITAITFSQSWKVGLALLPYQVWIFLAAALSSGYAKLN